MFTASSLFTRLLERNAPGMSPIDIGRATTPLIRTAQEAMSSGLSFDDGPGPSTPDLLDVLGATSCKATFFLLGCNLAQAQEVAVRMVREGHVLGNHCYSHARPEALSAAVLVDEIDATDALIRDAYRVAGKPAPTVIPLRLPYGLVAQDARGAVLDRLDRTHIGWTAIFDDWHRPPPSPHALAESMRLHIAEQVAAGRDVLLCLHDSSRHREARPATVAAVQLLLGAPDWRTGQQLMPARQEADAGD